MFQGLGLGIYIKLPGPFDLGFARFMPGLFFRQEGFSIKDPQRVVYHVTIRGINSSNRVLWYITA